MFNHNGRFSIPFPTKLFGCSVDLSALILKKSPFYQNTKGFVYWNIILFCSMLSNFVSSQESHGILRL